MGLPRVVDAAADLGWGGACAACERPGRRLCGPCRAELEALPVLALKRPQAGFPPTWARGVYADGLRQVLLACKERQGLSLARPLGELAALSAVAAVRAAWDGGAVRLVPVPSARATLAARGFDLTAVLAGRAAVRLRSAGVPARAWRGLRLVGGGPDQAGLDAKQRAANRHGRFAPTAGHRGGVLLVDDIVTTGATLAEAAAVLRGAGHRVLGAAVVAATPRRGPGR